MQVGAPRAVNATLIPAEAVARFAEWDWRESVTPTGSPRELTAAFRYCRHILRTAVGASRCRTWERC